MLDWVLHSKFFLQTIPIYKFIPWKQNAVHHSNSLYQLLLKLGKAYAKKMNILEHSKLPSRKKPLGLFCKELNTRVNDVFFFF